MRSEKECAKTRFRTVANTFEKRKIKVVQRTSCVISAMALKGDVTTFSVWVPITAPFSSYEGPGEVKLVDGDLVYVKLRPGTFSRQDDLQNLSYQRLERKNMLRVKHLWPDKKDLILVLANLRTPSAWVSSNNELGPCYGIIIVKDVFAGDASDIKAKLESGYIDHKADNVVFIPCPVPFTKLSVMEKAIVVASKDKLVIYDRETGVDITPTILKDPPKREGKKTTQQVDFSVATGSSFYVGRRIMETSLCLTTPWSMQQSKPRRPRHLPAHPGEVEWTLDRATFNPDSTEITVDKVMTKKNEATNRINVRLVTSWNDKLAYPMVQKPACPDSTTSDICLLDYADVLSRNDSSQTTVEPPKELARLEVKTNLSKRAEIKLVRKRPGHIGFKVDDMQDGKEFVFVFDTVTCQLTNSLRIHEMFRGFHKFRMTKESVLVGTRHDLIEASNDNSGDASDDVGTMKKRPVRYATIDGAYTVYRVRLGAVDGTPQILYRGEGVDFSVVYDREDFIVVHKNFDEITVVTY